MLSKGIVLRRPVMAQPREAANSAAKAQHSSVVRSIAKALYRRVKCGIGVVMRCSAKAKIKGGRVGKRR